ncbi:MAG TPA: sigma-54-dependent Fis family transcriptional regulator, partial [Shewanella frigidimarina]|nr:sigma-54-dependent Fis family transcriptional regulator [Shewanella frigidimarina]
YNGINIENIKTEVQEILKIEEYFPRNVHSNIDLDSPNDYVQSGYPIINSYPMKKLIEMAINV